MEWQVVRLCWSTEQQKKNLKPFKQKQLENIVKTNKKLTLETQKVFSVRKRRKLE